MSISAIQGARVPIRLWTPVHEVESQALDQLKRVAALPWVFHHVAVMPDVHYGKGCTVGSVIAMKGAVSPAAVGVDIGCGMAAIKTSLKASDLPVDLKPLRLAIEAAIPVGFHEHDSLAYDSVATSSLLRGFSDLDPGVKGLLGKATKQIGTLGSGNHFIELCLDAEKEPNVWLMLHSGSRNIGKSLAEIHIERAKKLAHNADLPDKDLAAFLAGTPEMKSYRHDLFWAQRYAATNRAVMVELLKEVVIGFFPAVTFEQPVQCHHNYVAEEKHYGEDVIVTRKGAIHAGKGVMGIIPGSMGACSFIVRGLGSPESFESASHGAGRKMSRGKAKREITLERLQETLAGVECRKDEGVLDEAPDAYKDIRKVIAYQSDLVDVVAELRQVLCVKGQDKKKGEHGE